MNKSHLIFIAALGALLLSGCAKSGVETSPESLSSATASEQSIGFSTYTGRAVTKATAVLEKDFNVEAFLSGDTRTLYFPSTSYTYSSGSYTGNPVRYWPFEKTQNLDFYAVSPLKYTNTDSGEVDLKPSADSTITLTNTAGTTDVVAARVLNAPNGDTPAAVSLTFGHKLTKVAFTAVGQDQTKKYVISGLTLTANSTSTYSYAQATDPVTSEGWSTSSEPYAYAYVSSDVTIAAGTSTSLDVGSAKYLIPNQASTLTATVKYKIFETSGGTDVLIGDNSAGISVSLPTESWGINKSVVYNLKLGVTASPVTFTADVADWDTEAGKDITIKPVTSITLSSTALDLKTGGTSTLTATVAPEDASNKSISWSSNATGVATVDEDGKVTAVGAGTATITATASDGSGVTGTCTVTVSISAPDYTEGSYSGKGIKIGDTWWAPVNCGYDATNYPYGKLYQWGRKVGGGYNSSEGMQTATSATYDADGNYTELDDTKFYTQTSSPYDWYTNISSQQLSAWPMAYSVAGYVEGKIANPCPSGWRVPTLDELGNLCYTDWDSSLKSGTTKRGSWDGTNKGWNFDTLFLPAAGYRNYNDGSADDRGDLGFYWSSSVHDDTAWILRFGGITAYNSYVYRAWGCSIRCVQE